MIDASEHKNYASAVQSMSVRLLLTIAEDNKLKVMSGDVGNTFLHLPKKKFIVEQDWSLEKDMDA